MNYKTIRAIYRTERNSKGGCYAYARHRSNCAFSGPAYLQDFNLINGGYRPAGFRIITVNEI